MAEARILILGTSVEACCGPSQNPVLMSAFFSWPFSFDNMPLFLCLPAVCILLFYTGKQAVFLVD